MTVYKVLSPMLYGVVIGLLPLQGFLPLKHPLRPSPRQVSLCCVAVGQAAEHSLGPSPDDVQLPGFQDAGLQLPVGCK